MESRPGAGQFTNSLLGVRGIGALVVLACVSCSERASVSSGQAPRQSSGQALGGSLSPPAIVRFLEQATFGARQVDIDRIQSLRSFEAWIDQQFELPVSDYPNVCCSGTVMGATCTPVIPCGPDDLDAYPTVPLRQCATSPAGSTCYRDNYTPWKLQNRFYHYALAAEDQLRQRLVFALSQVLVASAAHNELNLAHRFSPYVRTLERDAFENFRTLLRDITLNPAMGRYLDLISDSVEQPNENYPRELLQLFSLGLFQLRPDGTHVLDDLENPIPTFDQSQVVELTRALSGWALAPELGPGLPNYKDPLQANPDRHDNGSKVIFGRVLNAGQIAEEDLDQALNAIFEHPNAGPFIAKALIQMLVTSNPSPAYVENVARAFNNNGLGTRGDLRAVIKAILLDPEARNDSPDISFGKLREPVLATTSLLRNFDTYTTDYDLSDLSLSYGATNSLQQSEDVFRAPSVFNFFSPYFAVPREPNLVGPEFGILSTTTTLARRNLYYQLIYNAMPTDSMWRPNGTRLDTSALIPLADDVPRLVEALNQKLLHGTMPDEMKNIIVRTVSTGSQTSEQRVREAVYLVATSAAYQVQR